MPSLEDVRKGYLAHTEQWRSGPRGDEDIETKLIAWSKTLSDEAQPLLDQVLIEAIRNNGYAGVVSVGFVLLDKRLSVCPAIAEMLDTLQPRHLRDFAFNVLLDLGYKGIEDRLFATLRSVAITGDYHSSEWPFLDILPRAVHVNPPWAVDVTTRVAITRIDRKDDLSLFVDGLVREYAARHPEELLQLFGKIVAQRPQSAVTLYALFEKKLSKFPALLVRIKEAADAAKPKD